MLWLHGYLFSTKLLWLVAGGQWFSGCCVDHIIRHPHMQGVRATLLPAKSFGQLPVSALIHFWTLRGTEAGKYPFAPLIFLYPPLIILFVCSWTLKAAQVYGLGVFPGFLSAL